MINFNELKTIDKVRYDKHLKRVFFVACLYLVVVGVSSSSLLIHFFGNDPGNNFWLNITGVAFALCSALVIYSLIKQHPFFEEIVYVRQIKAQLNYIYRKHRKIQQAAEQGDATAISILHFNYKASRYIYELDNNTLTLEELETSQIALDKLINTHKISPLIPYQPALLKNF